MDELLDTPKPCNAAWPQIPNLSQKLPASVSPCDTFFLIRTLIFSHIYLRWFLYVFSVLRKIISQSDKLFWLPIIELARKSRPRRKQWKIAQPMRYYNICNILSWLLVESDLSRGRVCEMWYHFLCQNLEYITTTLCTIVACMSISNLLDK